MTDTMAALGSKWYAVQTYSGHENKVQKLLNIHIDKNGELEPNGSEIQGVVVPTQEAVEIRNGKRITVTRRLYPGYVLVNMCLNERTIHTVNNIQGVIKFVGSGKSPQPLQDHEISKILGVATQQQEGESHDEIPFHIDQVVEITQGPFSDFSGTVKEIYPEKGKVKVEVSLFGRPTSVELDYTQLKGF
jgi:transcriptional antiterminator NusG